MPDAPAERPDPSAPFAVAMIPARMGSERFPGKVLAAETGRPLIAHVIDRARAASCVARVVVATDDQRVLAAASEAGAEGVLTSPAHPNGTSRLAEAAAALTLDAETIVINVQGDEPEIEPAVIDAAADALLTDHAASIGTVASPLAPGQDPADPNIVKAILAANGRALYFTRANAPHARDPADAPARPLKHVGVYAYRAAFLARYARLPETPLERTERLEQLRALEHGFAIAVAVMETAHVGIDTPDQYRAFVDRWRREHA